MQVQTQRTWRAAPRRGLKKPTPTPKDSRRRPHEAQPTGLLGRTEHGGRMVRGGRLAETLAFRAAAAARCAQRLDHSIFLNNNNNNNNNKEAEASFACLYPQLG
jgi:hypothetical protein